MDRKNYNYAENLYNIRKCESVGTVALDRPRKKKCLRKIVDKSDLRTTGGGRPYNKTRCI